MGQGNWEYLAIHFAWGRIGGVDIEWMDCCVENMVRIQEGGNICYIICQDSGVSMASKKGTGKHIHFASGDTPIIEIIFAILLLHFLIRFTSKSLF